MAVRVRRIGGGVVVFMLVLVLVLLVKCGEGRVSSSNEYRVGGYYYYDGGEGKVEIQQRDGVVIEGSTRVKVQHRYYDYKDDYNKKVFFNESITSKVMGFVLEDVKKVEGIRVKMMLNKLGQTSQIDTTILSGTSIGTGNYIMEVGLGTPTKALRVVLDTGSDLGWTQCKPCSGANSCYSQKEPIFDPSESSSYNSVPCDARLCKTVASTMASGCTSTDICEYGIQYLDGSFTLGNVATDKLKVGSAQIPSYAFGCGFNNQGLFNGFDGLLGFSRNALAFPAQTRSRVFTYCLPSPFSTTASGFLEFGIAAGRSAATPTVQFLSSTNSAFYAVPLSSLRVDSRSVIGPSGGGSLIIDSGTVITRLDSAIYIKVRDAFRRGTATLPPAPADAGQGLFDTCYKLTVGSKVTIPSVTFALGSGSGSLLFTPPADSLLYPMDDTGTVCFAFAPIKSGTASSILGNYQQQGFSFSFDIAHNSLSIKPNAC